MTLGQPVGVVSISLVDAPVALSRIDWRRDVEGIRVREITVDGRRWALVEYAPGAHRDEWCEDGHLGVVLSGRIEYEFEDGDGVLSAEQGDAFTLSTGRGHRGRNTAQTEAILLVIDDPAR